VIREILIAWSGFAAEQMILGVRHPRGLHHDGLVIVNLLKRIVFTRQSSVDAGAAILRDAIMLMRANRHAIQCVARMLLTQRRLSASVCRSIFHQAMERRMS